MKYVPYEYLYFFNEGDDGLWIGEILCWEVFILSGVEGNWIGRHNIGDILVLQGIGKGEVEFL